MTLEITLLGSFQFAQSGQRLNLSRRKSIALLSYLAVTRRPHPREALVALCWPELDDSTARMNLRRDLSWLRQQFLDEVLLADRLQVAFNPAADVSVDVHQFEAGLAVAQSHDHPHSNLCDQCAQALMEAVDLYQGEFMAGFGLPDCAGFEEWLFFQREQRRQETAVALKQLAGWCSEQGLFDQAIAYSRRWLTLDPWHEPAHQSLMWAFALAGRRHDALRQYQSCVDILNAELGVSPDPQTTALYNEILQGGVVGQAQLPPQTSPAGLPPIPIHVELETHAPFVARQEELDMLHGRIQDTSNGRGDVILLAGDTGVGKTRLAYEALRLAAASGMTTLLGACYEQEGQLPYQPFIEAFNRYLSDRNLPLDKNPILNFKRSGVTDPQQEQWALFNTAAGFLHDITRQTPLVFMIDDLHAADETSLSLFHFLARQTRSSALILLATYRVDIPAMKSFGVLLNSLYRERLGDRIHVQRLAMEDVSRLITPILGGDANPALIQAIFDITEGNPFFVQEVTQSLLTENSIEQRNGAWHLSPGAALPIPARLSEFLQERISNLGGQVETTLVAGAVLGQEFRFDVLRGLADCADGDVLDALDAALSGHLLEETETGYRFRHSLIRHTLYDSLSRARRTYLHTRAAETLEAAPSARRAGLESQVENLAYHYLRSNQRDRALPFLLQAGEKAASVYALEVAIKDYEDALALMDEFHLDDPARQWHIHESLGWWYDTLADIPQAVMHFKQALTLPVTETWQSLPRDRARLHRAAATVFITGGNFAQAEDHLQAALAEVDENEDASDYALLLYTMSQYHWHKNEYQQAFDVAQRSLAIAERLNDQGAIANAFEMLALACHSLGEWQSGLQFERQRASLAGHELDVSSAFDVHL